MDKAIESEFPKIWEDLVRGKNLTSQNKPLGVVLGGTPGAGKSILIAIIEREMENNVISINGDDFRIYHPNFNEIYKKYSADFPQYTSDFSNKMVERVIQEAKTKKLNLIVEGTFRRASTPIKTLSELKENGYETRAMIIATAKEIAWKSTIERYENDLKAGHYARKVDRGSFNEVAENLAENVKAVLETGKADQLMVYSRDKLLFHSQKDNPSQIVQIINDELNGLHQKKNLLSLFLENNKEVIQKADEKGKQNLLVKNDGIKMKL